MRLARLLVLWGIAAGLLILAATVAAVSQARDQTLDAASRRAENLTDAFAGHIQQNVLLLERYLEGLQGSIRDYERQGRGDEINHLLSLRVSLLPGLEGVFMLDSRGQRINSSAPLPGSEEMDATLLAAVRQSSDRHLQFSPPIRIAGQELMPVSLRLSGPQGEFRGVLVAMLGGSFFADFYGGLDVGQDGVVGMMRRDGLVLGRSPYNPNVVGKMVKDSVLHAQIRTKLSGTFREKFRVDGMQRLGAFRSIEALPIAVYVAFSEQEILVQSWRGYAIQTLVIGLLVALGVFGLFWLLGRQALVTAHQTQSQRVLAETLVDGVLTIDAQGRILTANQAVDAMFGYAPGELVGQQVEVLMPADVAAGHPAALRRAALKPEAPIRHCLEVTGCRKDGSEFPIDIAIGSWSDGFNRFHIGIIRDITSRKHSEDILRRTQKMEAIGKLSGGIAHDFNNLLGIIIGNLDLALRRHDLDEMLRKRLLTASRNASRGAELTKRILSFSREQASEPQLVDVNEVIQGMAEMLDRLRLDKVELQTRLAANLRKVQVDPGDLEDAILNLAINAGDAMPNGGTLVIETRSHVADHGPDGSGGAGLLIQVTDTGTGMSKEVQERAFEPFYTTKEAGKGTGLGLSMVYGFARRSKGHVRIYSELGYGTTIKLFLPFAAADAQAQAAEIVAAELPRGTETVLVVDDEADLRDVAVANLIDLGYRVTPCASATEALELLVNGGAWSFDLLFSDVVMPGEINGLDLAHTVRDRWPQMRVLMASGFTGAGYGEQAGRNFPILGKPYRKDELARAVRAALEERKGAA